MLTRTLPSKINYWKFTYIPGKIWNKLEGKNLGLYSSPLLSVGTGLVRSIGQKSPPDPTDIPTTTAIGNILRHIAK